MAGEAKQKNENSEEDTMFVERFVQDVLMYTLPKYGFPQAKIPNIICKPNAYHRYEFVKTAGVSTLRLSLLMRETWRQLFISERHSFESKSENVSLFLEKLATNCTLNRTSTVQSTVEVILASCNEVLLFLHHEGIDIDVTKVMKSISSCILLTIGPGQNVQQNIVAFFDKFSCVSRVVKVVTNFIKNYALPYGSRDDVSNLYLESVKRNFITLKKASPPETPLINMVKNRFGYLPADLVLAVTGEQCAPLSENLESASESILPETAKLPGTSESDVLGKRKSHGRQSTGSENVSKQTANKSEKSIKNIPEPGIADDLGQISLINEGASQTSHGAISKRKTSEMESGQSILTNDNQSREPATLPYTSESGLKDVSKQTTESERSSRSTPELGIEDDFGKISLIAYEASQTSHGAIPKRKTPEMESDQTILTNDSQSQEPATLPYTSESGSKDVSKQTTESERNNRSTPELGIEDDFRKISLIAYEASQTSHGAIPKRKTPEMESDQTILPNDYKPREQAILTYTSESGVLEGRKSRGRSTSPEDVFEQSTKTERSM